MTKRMIIMLLAVIFVIGGILGFKYVNAMMTKKFMASMGVPPQTVSTLKAEYQDWQPKLEAVGSLRAVNGVDLSSEVAGIVAALYFDSGGNIKEGETLLELRDDDAIGHLNALQASARLAETNYQRDVRQLKVQAVSQATVDSDAATLDNAKAQVAEQQAILDKKTIKAPFTGHLGIRQVDIGQYVNPGTPIVTLQQLDPIYVDFTLPEQALPQINAGQKVTAKTEAHPETTFEGKILALNPKVDEATRTVQIRAVFKNPDHLLLPGMFATILIESGEPQRYITLPQTAITFNPYGNTVFVVDAHDAEKPIAKQTFVTTGATRGDQIAILSGVQEGDAVVISGQLKLHNATPLLINNEIQPENDASPKPQDR